MTAGLYAARARLNALLLEKGVFGGQVLITDWIDNYPGFPDGVSGSELIDRMAAQAKRFGLQSRNGFAVSMDLGSRTKKIVLEGGDALTCESLILATGARPNQLGIAGEKELTGKGVSYCATCDGPFFRDQEIVVVGGGDTAVQEAIHLTKFATKVTVIHRRDQLRATKILQEKAFESDKIEFLWNTELRAIEGEKEVRQIILGDKEGKESRLETTGVFVLIGTKPNNESFPLDTLKTDAYGFVLTDDDMRTNIPGVMAVGDIRSKSVRQVVNATGEGAVAILAAEEYLT